MRLPSFSLSVWVANVNTLEMSLTLESRGQSVLLPRAARLDACSSQGHGVCRQGQGAGEDHPKRAQEACIVLLTGLLAALFMEYVFITQRKTQSHL